MSLSRVLLLFQEQEVCDKPPIGQCFELDHGTQVNNWITYPLSLSATDVINALRLTKAVYIPTNIMIKINDDKLFTAIPHPDLECKFQVINLKKYGISSPTSISVLTRSSVFVLLFSENNYKGVCTSAAYDSTHDASRSPVKSMWVPSGAYVNCRVNGNQVAYISNKKILNFSETPTNIVPKLINETDVIMFNENDQAFVYSNNIKWTGVGNFGRTITFVIPKGKAVYLRNRDTTPIATFVARQQKDHERLTETLNLQSRFEIRITNEPTTDVILYTGNNYKGDVILLSQLKSYTQIETINMLAYRSIGSISLPMSGDRYTKKINITIQSLFGFDSRTITASTPVFQGNILRLRVINA